MQGNDEQNLIEQPTKYIPQSTFGVIGFFVSLLSLLLFFMTDYNSLWLQIAGILLCIAAFLQKERRKSMAVAGIVCALIAVVAVFAFNRGQPPTLVPPPSEFDFSGNGSAFNFEDGAFDLTIDRFNFD